MAQNEGVKLNVHQLYTVASKKNRSLFFKQVTLWCDFVLIEIKKNGKEIIFPK